MKSHTFRRLQTLRKNYGPGIFGKIAQRLLALAFYDADFNVVAERSVQGDDIAVANSIGEKYALEVKTTDKKTIPISKGNIDALRERVSDGYTPLIAGLRMQLLEDWIIANIPLDQLRSGTLPLSRLRAYRMRQLEDSICPAFEGVVNQHFSSVLSGGEQYLIKVLDERRGGSP
jgi:Holliday junction resolvase